MLCFRYSALNTFLEKQVSNMFRIWVRYAQKHPLEAAILGL